MNDTTMAREASLAAARRPLGQLEPDSPSPGSALSWSAVLAGATGAAALSLILLILGTGLGLSSVSPWTSQGATAGTFGVSTIVWITFTQLAAAGMGGYLAGRLRTRWLMTHADEVYFRDTAHGFLAWGVATLVTAAMLTSAISAIVGGGAQAAAPVAGAAATTAAAAMGPAAGGGARSEGLAAGSNYFVESLFRKDMSAPATSPTAGAGEPGRSIGEVGRIFVNGMSSGALSSEDTKYVGQVVAQQTGVPQAEAEKRVTDAFGRVQVKAREAEATAREAADKARKTSSYAALWLFVSLLAGAFVASLAATHGGRRRDLF